MDPYLELFRDGHASLMLPPESIPKDNHLRINGSDGVCLTKMDDFPHQPHRCLNLK